MQAGVDFEVSIACVLLLAPSEAKSFLDEEVTFISSDRRPSAIFHEEEVNPRSSVQRSFCY